MTGSAEILRPSDAAAASARLDGLIPAVRKSFLSSTLSIAIFSALLLPQSPSGLAGWLAIRVVTSLGAVVILDRLVGRASPDRTIRVLAAIMAVSGAVWGLIPLAIQPTQPEWRAVVVLWLFGNQSVVTAVCSPSRPVFRAAIGSVTLVGAGCLLLAGDSFSLVLTAILVLGGAYSQSIFGAMHHSVNGAIEGRLVASLMARSLEDQQAELESANRALGYLASRDELTGLLNRRSFIDLLVDDGGRVIERGWLVYLDVDFFKQVNDTNGHAAGDRVLQIVADRWHEVLPAGGLLARIGGDEFAAWFDQRSPAEARHLAERLNGCLSSPLAIGDGSMVELSCSVGVTEVAAGESFTDAAARADRALYTVKAQGRNEVELVEPHRPRRVGRP